MDAVLENQRHGFEAGFQHWNDHLEATGKDSKDWESKALGPQRRYQESFRKQPRACEAESRAQLESAPTGPDRPNDPPMMDVMRVWF